MDRIDTDTTQESGTTVEYNSLAIGTAEYTLSGQDTVLNILKQGTDNPGDLYLGFPTEETSQSSGLNIQDSAVVNVGAQLSVGGNTDMAGESTINVDSADLNAAVISVGDFSDGTLNVSNGGVVTISSDETDESGIFYMGGWGASNVSGTVNVSGEQSSVEVEKDFYVNGLGRGTLNISDGGSFSVQQNTYIGNREGTGNIVITGEGSSFEVGSQITVGSEDGANFDNTIKIENGGVLNSRVLEIGNAQSGGTVTVDGSGSTLILGSQDNGGVLNIGSEGGDGSNRFLVQNGATAVLEGGFAGTVSR